MLISAAVSGVKTKASGVQKSLVLALWVQVESGLEREGSLLIELMTIYWLSVAAFLKFLYQKVKEYLDGDGKAGPQKLFHLKRSSLSPCPCTKGPDPTIHRLPPPPPPKVGAFQ